jgi:hypothetical protein
MSCEDCAPMLKEIAALAKATRIPRRNWSVTST